MSQKKIVNITDSITVDELAGALNLSVTTLIGELFKNGIVATINQRIDFETAVIVVEELGLKDVELKKKAKADEVTSRLNKLHEVSENAKPRLIQFLERKRFRVKLVESLNIFQPIKPKEKVEKLHFLIRRVTKLLRLFVNTEQP